MKISIKEQHSNLCSKDIKWYLSDESLWITKHKEYAEIEERIGTSVVGSFNWLYKVNATVLFNRENGQFETAIIDLKEIHTSTLEEVYLPAKNKQIGNLFFEDKDHCNFEFPSPAIYIKDQDALISLPVNLKEKEYLILFIVEDFGFVICDHQLEGWILKNASNYVFPSHIDISISEEIEIVPNNNQELLENYLNVLNRWMIEEEDTVELKNLMNTVTNRKDAIGLAVWECIRNILYW